MHHVFLGGFLPVFSLWFVSRQTDFVGGGVHLRSLHLEGIAAILATASKLMARGAVITSGDASQIEPGDVDRTKPSAHVGFAYLA